jgi:hypothetical protein
MTDRADHLRQLARNRHEQTADRAQAALDELVAEHAPITFRGVAERAQVSLDFLYRTTDIRGQVEQHRRHGSAMPRPTASPECTVIHALTAQIGRLRAELTETRRQLASAHGEIIRLRRQRPPGSAATHITDATAE